MKYNVNYQRKRGTVMRAVQYYSPKTKRNEVMLVPDRGEYGSGWSQNMVNPITIVDATVIDDHTFEELKPEIQSVFKMWVWMTFEKRETFNPNQTSADITRLFRQIFGVWITENQVKDALYQFGYEASAMTKAHWHYKIRELRDPGVCPVDARFLTDLLQDIERR